VRTSDPRQFSRSRRGSSGPSTRPIGRSIDRFCGVLPVVGTTPSFPLSCDGWSFPSDPSSRNVTPRFPLFRSSPAPFEPPPRTGSGRRLPMVTLTVPTPTRSDGLRRSNSKEEVVGRPLPTESVTPPFPVFCGPDIRWSVITTSGGLSRTSGYRVSQSGGSACEPERWFRLVFGSGVFPRYQHRCFRCLRGRWRVRPKREMWRGRSEIRGRSGME